MGKIYKIENNFTLVCNTWLKDPNLSAKAKGILCFMQSVSDDWEYSINGLATQFNDGVESIRSGVKELVDAGYITWQRHRDEQGRVRGNDVFLHEKPIKQQDQQSENTSSRFSLIGAECNNKIKTLTNKRSINDNTNVLSLDTSVETVKSNNETSLQKTTYGSERINQAFTWWQEAFGYELKPSQANRRAVWNMLRAKNKGEQWVKQMLALLVEAKKDKYSGIRIANYADLQRDWEKLMAWGSSRYEQRSSNEDEFDRLVSQL